MLRLNARGQKRWVKSLVRSCSGSPGVVVVVVVVLVVVFRRRRSIGNGSRRGRGSGSWVGNGS